MYCEQCGHEVKDGQKFCARCGYALANNRTQYDVISAGNKKVHTKKKKTWKIVALFVLILMLCSGGIILYHLGWIPTISSKMEYTYLACVSNENGKYGYISENGEEIIPCQYDIAYDFGKNGLAIVGIATNEPDEYLYGCIDQKGKIKIDCKYEEISDFAENGVAVIKSNGMYGYINELGKMITSVEYDEAYGFETGYLALVMKQEDNYSRWGYIDQNGKEVVPCRYSRAEEFQENGLARVYADKCFGYVNEKGEEVIPCQYEMAGFFGANGLAAVKKDGKWGFINENGQEIISCQFDDTDIYGSQSLIPVKKDDKWGYINEQGEVVIDFEYDDAYHFEKNGFAAVKKTYEWGCINESGVLIIPFSRTKILYSTEKNQSQMSFKYGNKAIYEYLTINSIDSFGSNILVRLGHNLGLVNENGVQVIPFGYSFFEDADEEGFFVGYRKYEMLGGGVSKPVLLTLEGDVISEGYEYISSFGDNDLAAVSEENVWKYIDREGNVVMTLPDTYTDAGKFVAVKN